MPAYERARAHDILRERFGLTELRPDQEAVIEHVHAGGDALVLWPTGSGKSLCFQLPALLACEERALTIVLSPLIALMQDQVEGLRERGIDATFLNSTLSRGEREKRQDAIARGRYPLLYVTPERFRKDEFRTAIQHRRVVLLAVDEAHCISEWGHDFRPDYGKVGEIRRLLGDPPTIALTATATQSTAKHIAEKLRLAQPRTFRRSVTRDNLELCTTEVHDEEAKLAALERRVRALPGAGIVYCALIRDLENVRQHLARTGRKLMLYHGDLPTPLRARMQREFLESDDAVVIATNAFGMGVDKANIRFILHAQIPGSVEAYAQEIGRAGRDGKPAHCELFYREEDLLIQKQFIEWANPGTRFLEQVLEVLRRFGDTLHARERDDVVAELLVKNRGDMRVDTALAVLDSAGILGGSFEAKNLRIVREPNREELEALAPADKRARDLERLLAMVRYARDEGCRRRAIERYFDAEANPADCGTCDRCDPNWEVRRLAGADHVAADRVAEASPSDAPVRIGDWILLRGRHAVRVESIRAHRDGFTVRGASAEDFRIREYDLSKVPWEPLRGS